MIRTRDRRADRLRHRSSRLVVLAALLCAGPVAAQPASQRDGPERSGFVDRIAQEFDVLPLRDGVALRPKSARGIRSIEVSGGAIAVDGQPVTGAELRERVSVETADAILQLSYMSPADQRALFGDGSTVGTPAPGVVREPDHGADRRARRNARGDRVRIGGDVSVDAGEVVNGDTVAIGGSAQIEGEVQGDVVAIGGGVTLGPQAVVENDVVVIGGSLTRDPGARVRGAVKEVGWGMIVADRYLPPEWFGHWWRRGFGAAFALALTLTRLAVLCLFAALVVLLGAPYVDRVAAHARLEPLKAGVIGFLSQLLFVPLLIVTIVVLVATVIGIPLLVFVPFLVLAFGLAALLGFTAVAQEVGRWTTRRFGWTEIGPFGTTLLGIGTVLSPILLGRLLGLIGGLFPITSALVLVGLCVEYLAWTIGFGAVALTRFQKPASHSELPAVTNPGTA
jgi:hypothetical protein